MSLASLAWIAVFPSPPASAADADLDGLDDEAELGLGTDPQRADTDGDRFSDGGEVRVLLTDPLLADPRCAWPTHAIANTDSTSVWPTDLDLDGDLDLLDAHASSNVYAWENLGPGAFAKHEVAIDLRALPILVRAIDLDEDGLQEVLVADVYKLWTVRNQGGFVFGPTRTLAELDAVDTLALEDMDLDGDRDIVAWSNSHDPPYELSKGVILGNLGGGRFTPPGVFDEFSWNLGIAVGDLDNDGWSDVVAGWYDVWWYRSAGGGGPLSPPIFLSDPGPQRNYRGGLSVSDLDDDGWADIVFADDFGQQVAVLWNAGAPRSWSPTPPPRCPSPT